ncbi:DUF385 domain-containing protein [Nocardioides mangrovicus]|uniref:DUF385 domain-containing protein n=1 Tax=Nocardioides mangrovicus TaxID=2478913 RepID=A0A3L8P366_9ACTN|nr:nitroreductase/quinone reductase family protein [Nocardioides mangrovicus]RLV49491.1 DUF385 domain-containing protein [Nocardioides mangrovicus]
MDTDVRRRWVNRLSRIFHVLQRVGVRTGRAQILTTTGRKSGQAQSQPVGVVPIDGKEYIFQAYPRAAWVANARQTPAASLASGRRVREVVLVEQPVETRRQLLLHQLRTEPDTAKLLVKSGLVDDSTPEGVAAAAERIAVFEVQPGVA